MKDATKIRLQVVTGLAGGAVAAFLAVTGAAPEVGVSLGLGAAATVASAGIAERRRRAGETPAPLEWRTASLPEARSQPYKRRKPLRPLPRQ
jgi:hypothetical protein